MKLSRFLLSAKSIYHLSKAGISLTVALTTATGYLLSIGHFDLSFIYPFSGVLLLAMSASALNQLQERKTDRLMPRTSKRPLVSNQISFGLSIILIILFFITGAGILYFKNGFLPAILGIFNLIWYNAIYTLLKYKTAFAAFPGGIVGAIPPVIGWVSGGGYIFHPSSIALAVFFFIGQIPHFWILILKYSSEYQLAGIKSITEELSPDQIKRLIFSWVLATAISGSLMAFFILNDHYLAFYTIQFLCILLITYFIFWLLQKSTRHSHKAFLSINLYYLIVMLVLVADLIF